MNDWQDIIGGTWYSSSPSLLNRNHHYHHQNRRFDGTHQSNSSSVAGLGGTNNGRVRVGCIFSKRWLLFFLFHLGCLAMDHSTRELSYEEDQIRLIVGSHHHNSAKSIKLMDNESQPFSSFENTILSFHPNTLDFKESPVGIPRLGIVRVENRLNDENVKLISISGNTVHFHSSFFADKSIAPGGNTTFEIVFLSRAEGQIESSLYIHTSKGLFKYQVQGYGLPNPYRLKPLVGARIPINGSYEPVISIHNPHSNPIQVVEMLSSDTDFHLSLPDGVPEDGEGIAWAIEPFQTKSLMKGSFQGKSEGNHTGYIKIRVNSSSTTISSSEYLLVPVEVQVSSTPGIYSPQDCLDFGLMVRADKPKTLSLSLINAQRSPVNVQSVTVKGDGNSAVKIEFRPLSLEPDNSMTTVVALVTFDPSKAHSLREVHGFIEIRCDSGDSLVVPFRSNVLQGQLEYNSSTLGFFVKANHILPRNFSVRNSFTESVAIYDVSVSHPEIVEVEKFNQSQVITPGEQKDIFAVRVNKKVELCESTTLVQVTLKSNITNLKLPITCYDGKLNMHTLEPDKVNFGRIELQSTHMEYFSVDNRNPVEIRLKSWNSNCSSCVIELVGMQKGQKEDLSRMQDFDSLKKSLFLQPDHMAVFSIEIRRPLLEGDFWAEAVVTTDHNQTIRVPFHFSVWRGAIHSDILTFDKAFPGKISFEKLLLTSTFNVTMTVRGVETTRHSPVWFTTSSQQEHPEVLPHGKNYVGKIHFDPKKLCGCDCYSGFNTDSIIGRSWVSGMNVSWDTGETDWDILKRLQRRYDQVKNASFSNISLWVETTSSTEGSGYKIKTLVTYAWPRLTSTKAIVFPLTALGNESLMDIPITNPSNSPLIVQALLANEYGPLWSQFVQGHNVGGNITDGNSVFFLDGLGASSSQSNESSAIFGQVQRQAVTDMLDFLRNSPPGVLFFLPSGARFHIRVKFKPNSKEMASTMLLLRNNLTGVETTWLKGRAGTGQLTVGNGTPGSSLHFQITEKLLQGCHQRDATSKYVQPQLTVRRSFVARNVGEIPVDIQVLEVYPPQNLFWTYGKPISVQGDACEGYGFRILNCQPFTLLPNQTHSIDIAFSPDFTMSKIMRTLRLTDSTGMQFNYSLVAMVPSGMLKTCSAAIARPQWEPILKYLLVFGIGIAIITAALMAYFDAGTIVSSAVVAVVRVVSPDHGDLKETHKLDLKSVYDKVDNRFKRNQLLQQAKNNSPPGILQLPCSSLTITSSGSLATVTLNRTNAIANTTTAINSANNNLRSRKKKFNNNVPTELNLNHSTNMPEKSNPNKVVVVSGSTTSPTTVSPKSKPLNDSNSKLSSPLPSPDEISRSNVNHNTPITSVNNSKKIIEQGNNKKKKNQKNQNKNNAIPCTLPLTNGTPLSMKAAEEETSSTTTESSNADDLNANLIALLLENDEKERKLSGKSNESGSGRNSSVGLSENKNKKGQGNKNRKNSKSNIESVNTVVAGLTKGLEEFGNKNGRTQKKKELSGSSSSGSRGSLSPKQDLSLWDTPRPPSGDGFSELVAQTEAFVMQKSSRRSNFHEQQPPLAGSNLYNSVGHRSPPSSVYQQIHQPKYQPSYLAAPPTSRFENSAGGLSSSRGRVPGVIGQQRVPFSLSSTNSSPPPASLTHAHNGFLSNVLTTTLALSMTSSSGPSARQHIPPSRTLSSPSSAWGNETLSDNGCDIWNRRIGDMNNPAPISASSSNFRPPTTTMDLNNGLHLQSPLSPHANYFNSAGNGFPTSSSSSSSKCSHYKPDKRQDRELTSPKSNELSPTYPVANSPADSFLYNSSANMLTNELLSNLWQNHPYENTGTNTSGLGYLSSTGNAVPANSSTTNSISQRFSPTLSPHSNPNTSLQQQQQHGYLQRMRSEPANRLHSIVSSNSNPTYFGGMPENQPLNGRTQGVELNNDTGSGSIHGWPTCPSSSNSVAGTNESPLFNDWNPVASRAATATTSESLWETSDSELKWSRQFDKKGAQTSFNNLDPLAVGGTRARMDSTSSPSTGGLGFTDFRTRPPQDVAQSQREVEAGLGFNPFMTDIWNQGDSPGWTNAYQTFKTSNSKTE